MNKQLQVIQENNRATKIGGGGYSIPEDRIVVLSPDLQEQKKMLTCIHEVLEIHLHHRVRHSKLDAIAIDIIDALIQAGIR